MTQPKAFIFDLDGVIGNTIDLHENAWKRLADEENVTFDQADMDRTRGWQRRDIIADMIAPQVLTPERYARLAARKTELYVSALHNQNPESVILAGAVEIIQFARSRGFKVALASSSASAKLVLKHAGIIHLFDAIADGRTVKRSKPAPDIFVWAAGALNVSPQDAIVFEDAAAGVQAGTTAGAFVVGIGDLNLVHAAHLYYPDLVQAEHEQILLEYGMFRTGNKPASV